MRSWLDSIGGWLIESDAESGPVGSTLRGKSPGSCEEAQAFDHGAVAVLAAGLCCLGEGETRPVVGGGGGGSVGRSLGPLVLLPPSGLPPSPGSGIPG